jgi:hypothetical protein
MDLKGFGDRMSAARWHPENPYDAQWRPVPPNRTGLDPPNIKITDSGGVDLDSGGLDVWMLAGLEWIGRGDGGYGILERGDWKILTRSSFRSSADSASPDHAITSDKDVIFCMSACGKHVSMASI